MVLCHEMSHTRPIAMNADASNAAKMGSRSIRTSERPLEKVAARSDEPGIDETDTASVPPRWRRRSAPALSIGDTNGSLHGVVANRSASVAVDYKISGDTVDVNVTGAIVLHPESASDTRYVDVSRAVFVDCQVARDIAAANLARTVTDAHVPFDTFDGNGARTIRNSDITARSANLELARAILDSERSCVQETRLAAAVVDLELERHRNLDYQIELRGLPVVIRPVAPPP